MFTLEPQSVALIGASEDEQKLGHAILKNLNEGTFKGKIFPVNPKHTELLGLPCVGSVADVSEDIDMAIIVTPAATVISLAKECGEKGVKTLVIISAGFGEMKDQKGHDDENELLSIASEYDMRIVGPNCLGLLRPSIGLNASFATTPTKSGSIALISQSGAMAVALLDRAEDTGHAFSFVASIGNKVDLNESDFLEICEQDTKTSIIGLYLESIKDGNRFIETAKRVTRKKPIVLLKSGISTRGSTAVSSHTGALAGNNAALDAVCESTGIHRVHSTEEFLDTLLVLSTEPTLLSKNIAVITNAGGPGVLATDAAEREELVLTDLDETTKKILQEALPASAGITNPIDVLGDARADRYQAAIDACMKDANIDGLVILLTPQVMTPCEDIAKSIVHLAKKHSLMPIVTSFIGGPRIQKARAILIAAGIPCLDSPEAAIRGLASLLQSKPPAIASDEQGNDDRSSALSALLREQSGLLSDEITDDVFALYALSTPEQVVAHSEEEAEEIANKIGYPVIAKVSSPDILHKTDIGGVQVHITSPKEVREAYRSILVSCQKQRPEAAIRGVLIQQFLPIGNEFIVGAIRDETFGPLVMVGLGGIYTELFQDRKFALAPVTHTQAYTMLTSLQSWRLLQGMRGKGALDIDGLADLIQKISVLISDHPKISAIDLNPVFVSNEKIMIADAKIVME